jgi:short-subunit dehydrogenase
MKSNQFVLITGATSKTGRALAALFAADGYNLMIVAKSPEELAVMTGELTQQYKIDIIPMAKDLFVPEEVDQLYKEAVTGGIVINILVNNGEDAYTADDAERTAIRLNTDSLVILTRHFLKDMVARGNGKILNVGAVSFPIAQILQPVYKACNAFINSFTEAIKNETKDSGVSIQSLLAAAVYTDDAVASAYKYLVNKQ